MNRRRFLIAGLAGVTLPVVARAFGGDPSKLTDMSAAFHRAASSSRKLLVFVVPELDGEKWQRGEQFGEFLNYGPEGTLARLAEVELVAATMADLRTLVPNAPAGEPLMILVDPTVVPSTASAIDPDLPPPKAVREPWSDAGRAELDMQISARIDLLAATIDDVLPAAPSPEEAHARYQRDVLHAPIPGAQWSIQTGCGSYFESEETPVAMPCGMGHVNARSARMLHFFSVGT